MGGGQPLGHGSGSGSSPGLVGAGRGDPSRRRGRCAGPVTARATGARRGVTRPPARVRLPDLRLPPWGTD